MNEPERTITMLAAMAGLRIGEILGLRWGRVHLDRHTVEIEETCYKGVFGTPKSRASRRTAPLAPVVVQALEAHRLRAHIALPMRSCSVIATTSRYRRTTCGRNVSPRPVGVPE
jgi:integrase